MCLIGSESRGKILFEEADKENEMNFDFFFAVGLAFISGGCLWLVPVLWNSSQRYKNLFALFCINAGMAFFAGAVVTKMLVMSTLANG